MNVIVRVLKVIGRHLIEMSRYPFRVDVIFHPSSFISNLQFSKKSGNTNFKIQLKENEKQNLSRP